MNKVHKKHKSSKQKTINSVISPEINNSKETALRIVGKGKEKLTKNQELFNKLTKQIETLEAEIISENEKLSRLLDLYAKKMRPILTENANIRFKLAMVLGDVTNRIKFGKKQFADVKEAILALCNDAFTQIEPNTEQEDFYDKWSKTSYKEELEEQKENDKELISNLMNQMFGVDINMDEFEATPEGAARFQAKLKEEFEKTQENEKNQKKKKTKKQLQQEEQLKAEEEIKNKGVRSIYISLAKILHPDSETDLKLKAEKEEIMKKVTSAYDQKDLSTLLKLEMEWVHKETEHLEKLTEDKLKIYISALEERVLELEQEKYSIQLNPMFAEVSKYINLSEKSAIKKINLEEKTENMVKTDFNNFINDFEKTNNKKPIIDFVNQYLEILEEQNMMSMFGGIFDIPDF